MSSSPKIQVSHDPTVWPAWKYGLKQADLECHLRPKYNTLSIGLQSDEAFFQDLLEVCRNADDLEELHQGLKEKRQQRYDELSAAWDEINVCVFSTPRTFDPDEDCKKWINFARMSRELTYECILGFSSSFLLKDVWEVIDGHLHQKSNERTGQLASSEYPTIRP